MTQENKWKWLLGIFLIILLGIALYLSSRERYFNSYEFSKENFVTNRASKNYLDTIVQVGLDEMGIANHTVLIMNQSKQKDLGDGYQTQAYIINDENQSLILVDKNISRNSAIEILAHELIHLKQYHEKRLVILDSVNVEFEGEIYNINEIPYDRRLWETEAFSMGDILTNSIRYKLYEN